MPRGGAIRCRISAGTTSLRRRRRTRRPEVDPLPDLSVVLAVREATPILRESVRRLVARDSARPIELLLACAGEAPAARLRELFPAAHIVAGPPGALTPHLWGLGIVRARAPR